LVTFTKLQKFSKRHSRKYPVQGLTQHFMLTIVKIGGNIIDDETALTGFLSAFAALNGPKILVHGGGKLATDLAAQLGVAQTMNEGRRITDAPTLRIVTMVYAGWINKGLVARLNAAGLCAIGLCGADAGLIPAVRRPVKTIDYGFVGDVLTDQINIAFLRDALAQGLTPVVAPISAAADGQLLNVNADTIAQSLAIALAAHTEVDLIYSFDKPGVMLDVQDPGSVIPVLDRTLYAQLRADGAVHSGMIPKLDNAFFALEQGVRRVMLGQAVQLTDLTAGKTGTVIVP
jgi:acetylglutamate kinase